MNDQQRDLKIRDVDGDLAAVVSVTGLGGETSEHAVSEVVRAIKAELGERVET